MSHCPASTSSASAVSALVSTSLLDGASHPRPRMNDRVDPAASGWFKWLQSLANSARWVLFAGFAAYLAWRLTLIGWQQIFASLPMSSVYYIFLVVLFFILPVSELFIYRAIFKFGDRMRLAVILRKQFLNAFVLEYSGESYLYLWARRNLNLSRLSLIHSIKDSNVLSAGAGLATFWLMLATMIATGNLRLPIPTSVYAYIYAGLALLPFLLCMALVLARRRVTTLDHRQIAAVFGVHFFRCVLCQAIQFLLWWLSGALPSAGACFNFVMLRLLISRLPFVPNKDLVFLGSGLAAASSLDLSIPPIASVLVTLSVSDQLLNLSLAALPWLMGRRGTLDAGCPTTTSVEAAQENGLGAFVTPAHAVLLAEASISS